MLTVGPCTVEAVRCENPGMAEITAIDRPMRTVQTGPAQIEVDVVVPAQDFDEAKKLSEAFGAAADVEFAGWPWRITSCTWFMGGDEKALELTLHGRVPIEQTSEIMAQIESGANAVQIPTAAEQQGPGGQALKAAGEKDMEKRVRRNTRLGTLDDLT